MKYEYLIMAPSNACGLCRHPALGCSLSLEGGQWRKVEHVCIIIGGVTLSLVIILLVFRLSVKHELSNRSRR